MSMPLRLMREALATPVGLLTILTDGDERLRVVEFEGYDARMSRLLDRQNGAGRWVVVERGAPSAARRALEAYFEGEVGAIDVLPTATGGTDFQRRVWAALRDVPAAAPSSYGALAARIGKPSAVRAAGLANGANPIAIVVPCHRIVGWDGRLTGYGGGLERKRWLLDHEAKWVGAATLPASPPARPATASAR